MPAADPKPAKGPTRRRYTDEEKAEAVRLADELGSDSAAGRQLSIAVNSIANWRKAGHGKKPKPVNETAENRGGKQPPSHDGPKTKCSVCRELVPVVGEVNEVSRLAALREHYKVKPECQDAIRRRHA